MSFSDIFKVIAPTIATVLGGPLAGAAVSFLADKMGVSDATQDKIQELLSGTDPVKLKELEYDFKKFMADNVQKLDLAQISVNVEEAKSQNLFVAGWRPAVGWIGAAGLAYAAILEPLLRFVSQVGFAYTGLFPVIDTMLTLQVLLGILGLGAMRSFDKKTGNGHGLQ